MIRCFLGLGSNLAIPQQQIQKAIAALRTIADSQLHAVSPIYRSTAIGPGKQPDYLNAVAELHTTLDAMTLLRHLQAIEHAQGRIRLERWGPRTLDIDMLLYGDASLQLPALQVPHPRLRDRNFVLYPLHDLHPSLRLPDGTSLRTLLDCCSDQGLQRL